MRDVARMRPFRVVKHVGEYEDNQVIKYFEKYNDAVGFNIKKSGLYWIECLCVDGDWYGLA